MDSGNLKGMWTTSVDHLQNQFQMLNCSQDDGVLAVNGLEEDTYAFRDNELNHVLDSQEHSIFHDPFMPLGEPFPCIADELEQQAKALEFHEWARSASTRALPPLSSSGPAKDIPTTTTTTTTIAAAAPIAASDSPLLTVSPSGQDTLDPETLIDTSAMLPCSHLSQPPPSSSAQPTAGGLNININNVPLAAALENARSVRIHGGKSCQEGGWRGCCGSPWCNRERSHLGPCNSRASVPGLAAYPDALLSTAGVDLQKLCYSTAGPAGGGHNNNKNSNKRPYYSKNNDIDNNDFDQPLSPTGVIRGGGLGASGGEDLETSSPTASGGSGGAYHHHHHLLMAGAGAVPQYRLGSNKNGGGDCVDEFYSDEARSALTGEIKLHHHHSSVVGANKNNNIRMSKQGGKKASRPGNGGGGPMKPSSQALYLSSTKLKKQGSMKKSGGGGSHKAGGGSKSSSKRDPTQSASAWPKQPKGPRSGPRKQVTWVMGKATDPITGEEVTEVGPATFCTQCHAQSTPVWRAGPFGHKTLCNACGVRWMKIKPSGRKQD